MPASSTLVPEVQGLLQGGEMGAGRWAQWLQTKSVQNMLCLLCESTYIIRVCSLFSSVQSLSRVQLFATPWTAARQASLSMTNCWSLLKFKSIELVMPSNHLILCRPLLLPSIFPSIRAFSKESVLHIRWPKYWSFSISPSDEYSGLIFFRIDWFEILAVQGILKRVFSSTTV